MRTTSLIAFLLLASAVPAEDARLGKTIDLNGYFPFTPPATKAEWDTRKRQVREQLLVANGLWPMPEKTPLNAVVHGSQARDGYTVEKVFFASTPGHYVCGNLYRPTAEAKGKRPAVLCPHGHWPNGRFYERPDADADKELKSGAEQTKEGAKSPLQARCAQLARMGFVVFFYDMVGYADSTAIAHRAGFTDADAELRLQSFMGLQTWNTVRALDFLLSLPEVDADRIGVTGASGGGTQTFILGAIDDRPAVAFPAVMVSTAMQGGCICENCSYLRVGTGNIEIAGAFAPRPLGMSGANDWTIDIEKKGLPELKKLYALVGREEDVAAKCYPQFPHNYNQVAREMMYGWFNKHLLKRDAPVKELPFEPFPAKMLSVFDDKHPRPADELDAAKLRAKMAAASDLQMNALKAKPEEFRNVVLTALGVMTGEHWKAPVVCEIIGDDKFNMGIGRQRSRENVPVLAIPGKKESDAIVIWVHPEGKASLLDPVFAPAVAAIRKSGATIVAIDAFQTGDAVSKPMKVNEQFAGYTFGYNRPLLAQRVHDIRTAIEVARGAGAKKVHVVGWGAAGPWVALARALETEPIGRTAADLNGFAFQNVKSTSDEMMLPGAVKYGGMPAFLAACRPAEILAHHAKGTGVEGPDVYADKWEPVKVVEWLLK